MIVLEDDLPAGKSIKYYIEILNKHQNFNNFINAIWWFKTDYKKALNEVGQFVSLMLSGEDRIYVEQNIITAIWYFWFHKVQFLIKSEKEKLNFLTRSFTSISFHLSQKLNSNHGINQIWGKAWSIYNDLINHIFGML